MHHMFHNVCRDDFSKSKRWVSRWTWQGSRTTLKRILNLPWTRPGKSIFSRCIQDDPRLYRNISVKNPRLYPRSFSKFLPKKTMCFCRSQNGCPCWPRFSWRSTCFPSRSKRAGISSFRTPRPISRHWGPYSTGSLLGGKWMVDSHRFYLKVDLIHKSKCGMGLVGIGPILVILCDCLSPIYRHLRICCFIFFFQVFLKQIQEYHHHHRLWLHCYTTVCMVKSCLHVPNVGQATTKMIEQLRTAGGLKNQRFQMKYKGGLGQFNFVLFCHVLPCFSWPFGNQLHMDIDKMPIVIGTWSSQMVDFPVLHETYLLPFRVLVLMCQLHQLRAVAFTVRWGYRMRFAAVCLGF